MVGVRARRGSRTLLAAAALLVQAAASAADDVLVPVESLDGARLVQAADPAGTPLPGAGPPVFQRFVFVASAAVIDNDLYVADSGAGAVFRVDRALRLMTRVAGVPAQPATRVLAGPDRSLYVLDAQARRVLRVSRGGQRLASYASTDLLRPVDLALEEPGGSLLVADGAAVQLVAFHPLGGAPRVVALRGDERRRVTSLAGTAAGPEAWYVSDPACACLARVGRDGRVLDTFGHQDLRQPGAIAVDRHGRVLVADRFDGALKLFVGGRLAQRWRAASLGLAQLEDVRIGGDLVVLSGGVGARVALMRLREPAP